MFQNILKKYNIFAGNYGSGKTEISLNIALQGSREKNNIVLVDLDIVNPYFRSSEKQELLEKNGVTVIKPQFANTNVDVPSLPAEIYMPFSKEDLDFAVFDAGGDPVGAAAIGILKDHFAAHMAETEFFYVINTARPFQSNAEEIIGMMREIEERSSLKVTAIVNNTNYANQTTPEHLIESQKIIAEVQQKTALPLKFTVAMREIANQVAYSPLFVIDPMTRPEWMYR